MVGGQLMDGVFCQVALRDFGSLSQTLLGQSSLLLNQVVDVAHHHAHRYTCTRVKHQLYDIPFRWLHLILCSS